MYTRCSILRMEIDVLHRRIDVTSCPFGVTTDIARLPSSEWDRVMVSHETLSVKGTDNRCKT